MIVPSAVSNPPVDPGDTEIGQLPFAVVGEQDVRRFDVTVQGAAPVRDFQRAGEFHADARRIAPTDGPGIGILASIEPCGWNCITM